MNLQELIGAELKTNIVEARKNPKYKDPATSLRDAKIVSIADVIRIAEKWAEMSVADIVPEVKQLTVEESREWKGMDIEPDDVGVYDVFNDYVGIQFPIERAYWDGTMFRPINDHGQILSNDGFLSLKCWTEQMPHPVLEEITDNQ